MKVMLIGHFSKKPMVAIKDGDELLDPVDINSNPVSVKVIDQHVTIGIPGRDWIALDVPQAEELGFSILTVVEDRADLSYTIQRADRGTEPPRASGDEISQIDQILRPHIQDSQACPGLDRVNAEEQPDQ